MPDSTALLLFTTAALALLLVPGPAVLYIVARSLDMGPKAGMISTLGIGVGTLFHVAAAAFGVSAILVSSALAFNIVKYLGAAYLIFLGVRHLLAQPQAAETREPSDLKLRSLFWQGVWVNLLNPKTALFFFAFLPQFVNPAAGSVTFQILFLGVLFVFLAILSDGFWALSAAGVSGWVKRHSFFPRVQNYVSGGVFILLGLVTAFSDTHKK